MGSTFLSIFILTAAVWQAVQAQCDNITDCTKNDDCKPCECYEQMPTICAPFDGTNVGKCRCESGYDCSDPKYLKESYCNKSGDCQANCVDCQRGYDCYKFKGSQSSVCRCKPVITPPECASVQCNGDGKSDCEKACAIKCEDGYFCYGDHCRCDEFSGDTKPPPGVVTTPPSTTKGPEGPEIGLYCPWFCYRDGRQCCATHKCYGYFFGVGICFKKSYLGSLKGCAQEKDECNTKNNDCCHGLDCLDYIPGSDVGICIKEPS